MILPRQLTSTLSIPTYQLILLAMFLLFLGFILGINYSKNISRIAIRENTPKQNSRISIPTSVTSSAPTTLPTPINFKKRVTDTNTTKNWKTYNNTVHKYSIQYPPGWTIDKTDADKMENFENAICCNTAYVTISDGKTIWKFLINPLITGFQGPIECEPSPDKCSYENQPMSVLGYSLERTVIRLNSTNNLIKGYIITPGKYPAFGSINVDNEYNSPDQPKYILSYEGENIEKNLNTLDSITKSLKPMQ